MEAGDHEPLARHHGEDALAGGHRLLLLVVDVEMQVRPLQRHHIMAAGIGPVEQALAFALYMERQQTGRMSEGVDRADAGHHLVARLDEGRALGERQTDFHVELAVELARLAHVLALLPEVEIGGAEHITRLREHRHAALGQPADMIGMAVGDHHHVDVLRLVAGLRHARDQIARRQPAFKLLVLVAQRAVAGVEQHQLLAGIDHRRRERMLVAVGLDAVGRGERLHLAGCRLAAEAGAEPGADDLAVHDGGDLEAAELEAVDGRLHFALH